jgi:hypothetical protein
VIPDSPVRCALFSSGAMQVPASIGLLWGLCCDRMSIDPASVQAGDIREHLPDTQAMHASADLFSTVICSIFL